MVKHMIGALKTASPKKQVACPQVHMSGISITLRFIGMFFHLLFLTADTLPEVATITIHQQYMALVSQSIKQRIRKPFFTKNRRPLGKLKV